MEHLCLNECLDRQDEKKLFIKSFIENKITTIYAGEARGATTLLNHIFYSLLLEHRIVFFIDFKRKDVHIANQLGKQLEVYLSADYLIKDAFLNVILPGLLNCLRLPGTKFSVKAILASLKKIQKIGKLHIDDKYEELINLCYYVLCNENPFSQEKVYFIIDNATEELDSNEDFLLKISGIPNANLLLLCNNNRIERFINLLKKTQLYSTNHYTLSFPPDELIQLLCTEVYKLDIAYCQPLLGKNFSIYDICNILSHARNCNLTNEELDLCNLIHLFNNVLSEELLRGFLQSADLRLLPKDLDVLLDKKAILKDSEGRLICGLHCEDAQKNAMQEFSMMNYMHAHLKELSLSELIYFYKNTNILNLKSRTALLIINQCIKNGVEDYIGYVKSVDHIGNEDELLLVLCCLYKLGLYSDGIKKIDQFNKDLRPTTSSKFMHALFLERMYDSQALNVIKGLLLDEHIALDSKCYFAIVYVSCIINIGPKSLINDFFNRNSVFYFEKFRDCNGYVFLLNALGSHYKTDELLLLAHEMFDGDEIGFDKAVPNLIAFYDSTSQYDKCRDLLDKFKGKINILSSESAFYYNNKALHDLKYGTDEISSIISIFSLLGMKNRSEAATYFSKINYCIALIFNGEQKKGIKELLSLSNEINRYPSKPLLDNYHYNLNLAFKCFSASEQWNGYDFCEPTQENRNFAAYQKFLTEEKYDLASFKKHVKLCYLYERKFNVFTMLDTRL